MLVSNSLLTVDDARSFFFWTGLIRIRLPSLRYNHVGGWSLVLCPENNFVIPGPLDLKLGICVSCNNT